MEFGWKRLNRQIDEYQSELVQTHYAEVENMYRQMRGWRHDYRNHIQTMKAYAAKGDLEALRRYLDELDDDLTTLDMVIKTGNPMTDAILNSKISLARSKQVQVLPMRTSRSSCGCRNWICAAFWATCLTMPSKPAYSCRNRNA